MPYQIIQIIYWLSLSTWYGGVLFIAIAAPIIFRTVREANPVLPEVLSVNLEGAHANVLAGSIVANILSFLGNLQLICGGVLLAACIAQFFVIDLQDRNFIAAILRLCLIIAALAISAFDRLAIWPRLFRYRKEYLDHADDPEIAKPAKENFDREHHRSETLLSVIFFLLLGAVLFSANISPGGVSISREPAQTIHAQ